MVTINGKSIAAAGITLQDYLLREGYRPDRVAVELNGNIVPKRTYDETILVDEDSLEIVQFVGGG
jgi:thiamine biosynthesis protein ThiS